MRAFSLLVLVTVLALSALALPLTDASDETKTATGQAAQHDTEGVLVVAQVRPDHKNRPKKQMVAEKSTDSKGTANKGTANKGATGKSKRLTPITAEVESDVHDFVKRHHRELIDVLAHLKENLPKEYERAIRELNRNQLRLKQFEGRERYAAELQLWKAQSRTRLLAARVQMGDSDDLRQSLRTSLAEIYDLRAQLVRRDRDRTAERLRKLDDQLQSLRQDRDASLEKQLLALTKNAQNRKKSVKTSARNSKGEPARNSPAGKLPTNRPRAKNPPAKKSPPNQSPAKQSSLQTID